MNDVSENVMEPLEAMWEVARRKATTITSNNQLLATPNSRVVMRQMIHEDIYINANILCNYEDLRMNTDMGIYEEQKRNFQYEFMNRSHSLCERDMMLQEFILESETPLTKIHQHDMWAKFEQYATNKNLQLQRADASGHVQLSQEVLKPHLDNNIKELAEMNNNSSCKFTYRKDSGYFGSDVMDAEDIATPVQTNNSNVTSDIMDASLNTEHFNSGIVSKEQISTPKRKKVKK